jgi:hypothetical protein
MGHGDFDVPREILPFLYLLVICLDKYARQRSLICIGSPSNDARNCTLKELDSLTKTLVLLGGICYHYTFKNVFGDPDSADNCDHLPTSCCDQCSVCNGLFTKILIPVKRSKLTKMLTKYDLLAYKDIKEHP